MHVEHNISVQDFEAEALPHLDDLFRTARRMSGDAVAAQDLVQDVYLQAWKSFGRFQLGTNCRAWLFTILFNKLRHFHRARYTSKIVRGADDFIEETAAYEPPTPTHISDEEILAALDKLPPTYREVVLLADVQEFAYREIAEILEVPIGTVMSRLSRGRRLLRMELTELARSYGINNAKEGR